MSEDAAVEEIQQWCETLGDYRDEEEIKNSSIILAVREGRVEFNDTAEEFTYTLRKPVTFANGDTMSQVMVVEPEGAYRFKKQKVRVQKDQNAELEIGDEDFIQAATGEDVSKLSRMKSRDLNCVFQLADFFR